MSYLLKWVIKQNVKNERAKRISSFIGAAKNAPVTQLGILIGEHLKSYIQPAEVVNHLFVLANNEPDRANKITLLETAIDKDANALSHYIYQHCAEDVIQYINENCVELKQSLSCNT